LGDADFLEISTVEQDSEMMRLQLLGNPDLMRELQQVCTSLIK
jgi:hypothetical protein